MLDGVAPSDEAGLLAPPPAQSPCPWGRRSIIERDSPWVCVGRLGFVVVRMGLYTNC